MPTETVLSDSPSGMSSLAVAGKAYTGSNFSLELPSGFGSASLTRALDFDRRANSTTPTTTPQKNTAEHTPAITPIDVPERAPLLSATSSWSGLSISSVGAFGSVLVLLMIDPLTNEADVSEDATTVFDIDAVGEAVAVDGNSVVDSAL
jgi:hypothetical protein